MTLGQFALAVGASKRWVLNALAVLGRRPPYTVQLARRLSLARLMKQAFGVPLRRAFDLAGPATASADPAARWRREPSDGCLALEIDLARFHSDFAARLSLALSHYAARRRGRPAKRRGSAVGRAEAYGIDVSLLRSNLRKTPAERLQRLDEDLAFLKSLRLVRR